MGKKLEPTPSQKSAENVRNQSASFASVRARNINKLKKLAMESEWWAKQIFF